MAQKVVLVVDDEEDWRSISRRAAEELGCVVETAQTLQAAVALVDQKKYDLIISDNSMPAGDEGLTLLTHIRNAELNKDTKFVLFTGSQQTGVLVRAERYDARYVYKHGRKLMNGVIADILGLR
ncbi:MAG TPA: response regulator [Candidatus Paceibacterota bacterium]|nr:response regulator [Candidatus Paceibacterota bacterium]